MCKFHVTPRVEEKIWITLEIIAKPLSDCWVWSSPNWRIMFLITWVDTTSADSPIVGKASTHPEKVSTRVNRYFSFFVCWHMGKIDRPVFSRYTAPELVGQEGWVWFETTLRTVLGPDRAFLSNFSYKTGKRRVKE
jgi:hypothetical protein